MNALSIVSENERVTKDWEIFSQNLNPPQKLVLSWDFLALTGTYKSNSDRETLSAVCEYESVEDFIAKFTSGKRPHLNDFEWSFLNSEGSCDVRIQFNRFQDLLGFFERLSRAQQSTSPKTQRSTKSAQRVAKRQQTVNFSRADLNAHLRSKTKVTGNCYEDISTYEKLFHRAPIVLQRPLPPVGTCYAIKRGRGVVLIFEIVHSDGLPERVGSGHDSGTFKKLWTDLGFYVELHVNKTAEDIRSILRQYITSDHSNTDCFVCCFMTHGRLGSLCTADGRTLQLHADIISIFHAEKCPGLKGKPKLFFFQCCRESYLTTGNNVAVGGRTAAVAGQTPATPEHATTTRGQTPATPEHTPATPEHTPATRAQTPETPEYTPAIPEQSPARPGQTPAYTEPVHSSATRSPERSPAEHANQAAVLEPTLGSFSSCEEAEKIVFMDAATKTATQIAMFPLCDDDDFETNCQSFVFVDTESLDLSNCLPPEMKDYMSEAKILLSAERDFLVSWATMPGEVATRFVGDGSPYINTIDRLVRRDAGHKHLAEIMASVSIETNARIKSYDQDHRVYSQLPPVYHTFEKYLYLPLLSDR